MAIASHFWHGSMNNMENMITYLKEQGWKSFMISFICVFVMVLLQHLGVKPPHFFSAEALVSPLNSNQKILDNIIPKLEVKPLSFKLKNTTSLVSKAYAGGDYDQAAAYGVVDYDTGEILFEKNSQKMLPIASLTKLMTAVVALDLANPNDEFTVSPNAPRMIPTRLALTAGEKYTLEELLNAALLTSANDCTQVIAENIDAKYGQKVFVDAMNAKAAVLGLKSSHFTNPQGFDDGHPYSTIQDYAILTEYALKNYPTIAAIVVKDHEVLTGSQKHTEAYLNNWQGLIGVYPGAMGVKIGNTDDAGYTTAVVAERGGKKLITIVLGTPGIIQRDMWAAELLDAGFQKSAGLQPINVTESQLRAKYATWKYFQ